MKMEHLGAISKAENFCFIFKANCPISHCGSVAQWCPNIWDPMDCNTPGFSVKHQLLETAQTHDYWVGDAIQLSHSLLSPSSAFHLSSIRVFSDESVLLMRWPKHWSFSFSISPSNEYSGLIFFYFDGLVGSPCSQRNSQNSSPIPQFKSIDSLVFSFLYSPALTSIHD